MSDAAIDRLRGADLDSFPAPERAALRFADAMARGRGDVDDVVFGDLRRHFGEAEMVEIACVAGLFSYFNRFNNAFRTDITLADPDVLLGRAETAVRGPGDAAERLARVAEILQAGRRHPWVAFVPSSGRPAAIVSRGPAPDDLRGTAAPGRLAVPIRRDGAVVGHLHAGDDRDGELLHEDRHVLEGVAALCAPLLG